MTVDFPNISPKSYLPFQARIRWFDELPGKSSEKIFLIHECNDIPTKSIICTVKVKRLSNRPMKVSLKQAECTMVADFLNEDSTTKAKSKASPSVSPKKKTPKKKAVKGKPGTKSKSKTSPKKKTGAKTAGSKRKAVPKPKPPSKKKKVVCYSNITLYKENPIWDSKVVIPNVAPSINSLVFTRAVKNKQYAEVEKLQKNKKQFAHLSSYIAQSGFCQKLVTKSAWHYAIDNKDKKMISLLKKLSDQEGKGPQRVNGTHSLLEVSLA